MRYIHEHPDWPQLRWDSAALQVRLTGVRHRQGLLLGRMGTFGFDDRNESSLAVLTHDVVKSSAIEGDILPFDEVRSSIARRLGIDVAGLTTPSRHVEGVVEMMLDATQRFEAGITRERLFAWHAALFPTGHSGTRRITVAAWRTPDCGPMQVVSGALGQEKVHFEAPDASRLEEEMANFLEWFNNEDSLDPVLKAGIAHFHFVTIHPFEDGNGRIARAIADLALARADGMKERFYSMSSQIEAERSDYYLRLEIAQRGGLDITTWLEWFLGCLDRAVAGAETVLAGVLLKGRLWRQLSGRAVNDRQRLVVERLLNDFEGFLTTSKYAKLAKCSADTALRDIRELVEWGALVQNAAGGRSTSYRLLVPSAGPNRHDTA